MFRLRSHRHERKPPPPHLRIEQTAAGKRRGIFVGTLAESAQIVGVD